MSLCVLRVSMFERQHFELINFKLMNYCPGEPFAG
jgi:hypothetical protein